VYTASKAFPEQSKAAAELLGPDLQSLKFDVATVFNKPGSVFAGVSIEFKTADKLAVWVDVYVGKAPKIVLDERPESGTGTG